MEPGLFVLAVMGCGDAAVDCRPVDANQQYFQSEATCEAAVEPALSAASDAPYPVLIAQCSAASSGPIAANDIPAWFGGEREPLRF